MRSRWPLVFTLVLSAFVLAVPAVLAQDTEANAGAYFTQALESMQKTEGFHVKLSAEVSLGQGMAPMSINSAGWVRNPDIAFYKMTAMGGMETETYRKGKKSVRKDATGQWQVEEGEGGLGGQQLANPMEYLQKFRDNSKDAVFLENEKLGDLDCRVVKANPPAEAIRSFIGGMGIPEAAIDWSKAKLTFRVWISKSDTLVRQVIADLEVELAGFGTGGVDDPAFDDEGGKKGDGKKGNGGDNPKKANDEHPKKDGDTKKDDEHPKKNGDAMKDDEHPKKDGDAKKDDEHPKKGGEAKKDGDGKKSGDGKKTGKDDDFGFDDGDEYNQPMKLTPRAKFEIYDYNKDIGLDKIPADVKTKLKLE